MQQDIKNNNGKPALKAPARTTERTPQETVRWNFGSLEDNYSTFNKAKVVIMSVPYEKTTTYKTGTKNGPAAIIEASMNMELYDEELNQETYRVGIHTTDNVAVAHLDPEQMVETVKEATLGVLQAEKFPVILGGEHTITVGTVKAFAQTYQNLTVLQLDAHYDLKDEYRGSKYNHACVGRRISEMCPLVQLGMRSLSRDEREFLNGSAASSIRSVDANKMLESLFWKDEVLSSLGEHVYISIDLDVFDPSVIPSVGTPEPGGVGWYETLEFLRSIVKCRKVVGFDVVELCPVIGMVASDFIAAKLIYRLLGYVFPAKK